MDIVKIRPEAESSDGQVVEMIAKEMLDQYGLGIINNQDPYAAFIHIEIEKALWDKPHIQHGIDKLSHFLKCRTTSTGEHVREEGKVWFSMHFWLDHDKVMEPDELEILEGLLPELFQEIEAEVGAKVS